jgi:GT2 family glycosyltransferase
MQSFNRVTNDAMMPISPKVYIILFNFNNWQDTLECLESLLKIDYSNYHIIIVDNASTDNSVEYIRQRADRSHKTIRVNVLAENEKYKRKIHT